MGLPFPRLVPLACLALLSLCLALPAEARRGAEPIGRSAGLAPPAEVERLHVPPFDLAALLSADEGTKDAPHRFAEPFSVAIGPATGGTTELLPDGSRVWRLLVDAPGATDLNFGFTRFRLPPGAALWASSVDRDYWEGPYDWSDNADHGELWLPVVPGDRALIELLVPADPKFEPELELAQVGWGYRDLFKILDRPAPRQGSCNNDVICPEGDPWQDEIQSVAVYQLNGSWTCTGQLVNNTNNDETPYFLTANHCGVSSSNDQTMVVYWNFESPSCGDLCCGSLSQNQTGAILRANRSNSDFCLVELEETVIPQAEPFFSGWDATGDPVPGCVAIHHPNCDEKAISFNDDPLTVTTYLQTAVPGDGTHWRIDNWEDGTTEPGSSGSGIWNPDHRLIGQLHGGYASCTSITSDWYGRLAVSWDGTSSSTRLRDWLDPTASGTLVLDGAGPLSVRYASHTSVDDCRTGGPGDANGLWEPGETISMPVVVRASGGAHTGVVGTLSTTTPGVTILNATTTWPNLAAGQTATSDRPFVLTISDAFPCYTDVDLTLSISSSQGGPWTTAIGEPVGQLNVPTGLPVAIPDGSSAGVTHSFTVGENVTLTDVNVRVQITHTYVGDIKIQLRSPAGTLLTLLDRPGVPASTYGCSNDDMDVTFDDASAVNLESYCPGTTPWYVGPAAPVQALSALNGQASQGTWQLIVSDNAGADTGTLDAWELITTPPLSGTCNVCSGGVDAPSPTVASGFRLAPPRPNPSASGAVLEFSLPAPADAHLAVFDVTGRRIATLVDGPMPAGTHAVRWDGTGADRSPVAAGIYFARLTAGDRTAVQRLSVLR